MAIKEKTAEEIGKKEGNEAEIKVFRHHYKDCSPEYRALYNEYKAAYVKARRLKNLEAERERMREYILTIGHCQRENRGGSHNRASQTR